jgi:hypothetical protein
VNGSIILHVSASYIAILHLLGLPEDWGEGECGREENVEQTLIQDNSNKMGAIALWPPKFFDHAHPPPQSVKIITQTPNICLYIYL